MKTTEVPGVRKRDLKTSKCLVLCYWMVLPNRRTGSGETQRRYNY